MRVLITGATGLIGQELVKQCLEKDIAVNYLTTNSSKIEDSPNYKGFYWNPEANEIDNGCLSNIDAIIHLAGASVSKRWTNTYKQEILSSRVKGTQLLINTLKRETHQVKHIISASAIGIYPDSQTNYYDQTHKTINPSFLGEVVSAWEKAVDGFSGLNIKISKIRIGLVLSSKGGALKEIVKPIRSGIGAAFGSGNQWQSWIHIKDLAGIFLFVLEEKTEGVFNCVAPNPVTNKELTNAVAKVLKKPLLLPNIPKFIMKLILGEMHVILFESQRVSSKQIESKGFKFEFHNLSSALTDLLK